MSDQSSRAASSRSATSVRSSAQRHVVIEQPAVEPGDPLEAHHAARAHGAEQGAGMVLEVGGLRLAVLQHPPEHVVRQQAHVLGEHAEHQPVDEMRDGLGVVAALAEPLGQGGELRGRLLGQELAGLARAQPLRFEEGRAQQVAGRTVR